MILNIKAAVGVICVYGVGVRECEARNNPYDIMKIVSI